MSAPRLKLGVRGQLAGGTILLGRLFGRAIKNSPPDGNVVVRRAQILAARVVHAMAWPSPDTMPAIIGNWSSEERERFIREYDGRARGVRESLESSGLWVDASTVEREFFSVRLLDRTVRQYLDSAWSMESLGCCLWALKQLPQMPAYDTQCSSAILEQVPRPGDSGALVLRRFAELEHARSIAELWHWRSRTRQLVEDKRKIPLPDGLTLDEIVRTTATKAAAAGDIPEPCSGDFPVFGKAYRDLSSEEYLVATSIAVERHRALNWVCGRAPANRWADTPTET